MIKIVAFLHRSQKRREGRDSYLCPLSVASVNYILLSTEHCFLLFLTFQHSDYFILAKILPPKETQLIRFNHLPSARSILERKYIIDQKYIIGQKFFNIITSILSHANRHSLSPFYSRDI